ncbi:MAG TPA: adenylate/guanylate cyclase domain-containing protein [Nitrospira sp.]|nr:adenylate/guanylate cyclase domain-containing protein [Nitrospira sp.]
MDDRVSIWLEGLGLGTYRDVFQQNAITWDVLPELTDEDLTSLGVLLGHRKKLLRAIAHLPNSGEGEHVNPPLPAPAQERHPAPSDRDHAERRQLTIMFCDLVGSTSLACQLDPEDLQTTIRRFLDTSSEAIRRFNGYVAKYMGDGILAYFGYPSAYEHDAERAVHAGLAVLDLVKGLPREESDHRNVDFGARIGIATGHVIVGEILGQDHAKERSVFGETPNLAARLQAVAAPNQVVIDAATKRLVGSEFEFEDRGDVALKGFEGPVHVWQVLSATPSVSRFESYRSGRLGSFVGREQETALLMGRWREAVDGEGQVVVLCGEAGIGKSRMVHNVGDRLAEEGCRTMQFQCSPYHTNTALYPVITYLRQAASLRDEDPPALQLQKLDAWTEHNDIDGQRTRALLADLLSIRSDARDQLPNMSAEKRKEMTLDALVQQLRGLADRTPTLFIVEDAHWLDPTTMDLLTLILDQIQRMRVLMVVTLRPNVKLGWAESSHVTFLTLSRLPRRYSLELLAAMTKGKALPSEVEQAILAKTDGIPLYIEELADNVLKSGLLIEEDNSFSLKAPLQDLSIPDSLQALLMERIDRLGPAKDIIQLGAVIGREFSYELLRETADVTEGELHTALNLLSASGIIFQTGEIPAAKYLFKHALVQDAAYSTLPKKSRRALHARIAKTLESRFAERVTTEPELLAYHYEQAGLPSQAIEYWRRAAERDIARSANVEAISHFDRALHLLKELPKDPVRDGLELALLIARGAPLLILKGYASDDIERNFLSAKRLSETNPGSEDYFLSLWGLWVFRLSRGPLAEARGLGEELLSLAIRQDKPALMIRAHESVGSTDTFLGRFEEAKIHLREAKSLMDRPRDRSNGLPYTQDPGITARMMLAQNTLISGEVDEVEGLVEEAITLARALEHPFTLAFTLATTAWVYSTLRDSKRTLDVTEEAIQISTKFSFEVPLAWAMSFQGWALAEQGQEKGIERVVAGLSAAQSAKASLINTCILALLAECHVRVHHVTDGLAAIQQAEELVATQGELCWQAELFRIQGELVLMQSGQPVTAAEQCFSKALAVAQSQQARLFELRAATSMARLLRKLNKPDMATEVLGSVRFRFSRHSTNPDVVAAQTILDELSLAP